jgi:hypothetical protein
LICHNFCGISCFLLSLKLTLAPGYAHLPAWQILHRDIFSVSALALYRDRCAGGFDLNPIPGFDSGRPKHCTAMAPACHQNCIRIGKNCAMLRSLRLWWHYLHSQFGLTASIRLSTTNALYCRAVMGHA